jgi:methionine--tRNA ligase beta chain
MLGYDGAPQHGEWDSVLAPVVPGQPLGTVQPLFPKRERRPAHGATVAASPSPPTASGLPPLEVRAARITQVENHPSADRLYVLTVDAGDPTPRTVVAGLRDSYAADDLRGRSVAVLANLEPRTIRRITSQGMVLAADLDGKAALLEIPEGIAPGRVIAGATAGSPTISYAEFERTPLVVGRLDENGGAGVRAQIGGRSIAVRPVGPTGRSVVVRLAALDATEGTVLGFDPDHPLFAPSGAAPGAKVR